MTGYTPVQLIETYPTKDHGLHQGRLFDEHWNVVNDMIWMVHVVVVGPTH